MVHVEILGGVVLKEGQLPDNVPVNVLENEEIIFASMPEARHARDGDEHPDPQQRTGVASKLFQPFFHRSIDFVCKDSKKSIILK